MARPVAAVFSMPDRGHFQRVRAIVSGLSRAGVDPCVFTHERFRDEVERAGGTFLDLFVRCSIDDADNESWPGACRYVTFAAVNADAILADVEAVRPRLVVHDTFAVIGRVVANRLGLPRVNVCAGHNVAPAPFLEILRHHPRVRVSDRCTAAVERLRHDFGMPDASPFSYVANLSADLNVYCEPPEFLAPPDRQVFEPLAFYGSLPDGEPDNAAAMPRLGGTGRLRLFASFGTVIWDVREPEALRALGAIADGAVRQGDVEAIISLGGASISASARAALDRPGVRVETYVDQARVLGQSDLCVTHHGLNSTHEAILHRVPMLSYPFIWDQPGQAETCRRLGVAIPLTTTPMAPLGADDVDRAFAKFRAERPTLMANLERAWEWEKQVMADRPDVIRRMMRLAGL